MKTTPPRLNDIFVKSKDPEAPKTGKPSRLAYDAIVYGESFPLELGRIVRLKRNTLAQDQAITYGESYPICWD